jgi:hypothetical protein
VGAADTTTGDAMTTAATTTATAMTDVCVWHMRQSKKKPHPLTDECGGYRTIGVRIATTGTVAAATLRPCVTTDATTAPDDVMKGQPLPLPCPYTKGLRLTLLATTKGIILAVTKRRGENRLRISLIARASSLRLLAPCLSFYDTGGSPSDPSPYWFLALKMTRFLPCHDARCTGGVGS